MNDGDTRQGVRHYAFRVGLAPGEDFLGDIAVVARFSGFQLELANVLFLGFRRRRRARKRPGRVSNRYRIAASLVLVYMRCDRERTRVVAVCESDVP